MGKKNNQIGAFPSNFVKEIFVPSKGEVVHWNWNSHFFCITFIILLDFLHNGYSALHNCCDKDCCNLSILCLWYFCSLVKSFLDKSTHASWEVFLSDMSDCFGWILVSCLILLIVLFFTRSVTIASSLLLAKLWSLC